MARIDAFLRILEEQGGSDLHLQAGSPPVLRIHGSLQRIKYRTLTHRDTTEMFREIMEPEQWERFNERMDFDFSYALDGVGRFRVNIMFQRNGLGGVFRIIPERIKTLEELDLPMSLADFASLERGLVLVTGPTGSGKSTTLAAIIDVINANSCKHIVTIEDPIEFVHSKKLCHISSREVGSDTESFKAALRSALRESPDVILVGEMRDLETISLALTCAETGCLVFGTLHTNSAAKTIDRLIDVFPADEQDQVRTMLALSLQGVVAQQLLKTADGKGRVAAVEILKGSFALSNLIREGKTFQIGSLIQSADYHSTGMQSMDQALTRLFEAGRVTGEEAHKKAFNKKLFERYIQ
jgi:twitching motility protein PilT